VGSVPFTAVDVYSWMREEGHLRSHKVAASTPKQSDDVLYTDWSTPCIPCSSNGGQSLDSARRSSTLSLVQHPTWKPSMSLDPSLTQYVVWVADPRRVIHCSIYHSSKRLHTVDQLGQASEEVQSALAPYALLAMCLRPFTHNIISSGLGVAKRQKDFAKTQVFPRKSNKWTRDQKNNISLLTPCRDKGTWKGWGSYRRSCVAMPVNNRDCPRISRRGRRSLLQ